MPFCASALWSLPVKRRFCLSIKVRRWPLFEAELHNTVDVDTDDLVVSRG